MLDSRSLAALTVGLVCAWPAVAAACPNPDALGTARTVSVDPAVLATIGTMQYRQTLALEPKEVVLTFDDGPMPPMTTKVLEILRTECVKATFFLIGRNARAFPSIVQEIARDGHTVANHTQNHPFAEMSHGQGVQEIDHGFRTIAAALEPSGMKPAPFFRFPGLKNTRAVESYANAKGVSIVSADFLADDWKQITPNEILVRGLARLEQKGSGIMLLHDVKPATALILPKLLAELKARGYRIVHMVPAPGAEWRMTPATVVAEKATPARRPAPRRQLAEVTAPAPTENSLVTRWRKFFQNQARAAERKTEP